METLIVERDAGVVTVTFNRPAKKNALTFQSWVELLEVLQQVATDPADRALVVTGAGGNFSSGADLTHASAVPGRPFIEPMRVLADALVRLHRIPKPTIAKVDGVCVGIGLSVALGCDLVVASDRARLSAIFPKRGLAVDGGSSWLLPRLVGLHKAKELALFGDMLSASDAHAIGLVNRVVPVGELDTAVAEWARRLASGPTVALSLTKAMLNHSFSVSLDQALEDEARSQHVTASTADVAEAMRAFAEKRDPIFRGC